MPSAKRFDVILSGKIIDNTSKSDFHSFSHTYHDMPEAMVAKTQQVGAACMLVMTKAGAIKAASGVAAADAFLDKAMAALSAID